MYKINNNNNANIDLTPINNKIDEINASVNQISNNQNLTTFIKTGGYSPGELYMDIEEFNTATGDSMWFSKPTMYNTMTLGYYHTLTNYSLTYSSTRLNIEEITEYSRASRILKLNYTDCEGLVLDKPNIGIYPWTNTTYDGYMFMYNTTMNNAGWTMPTLPLNVKSITQSFTYGAGVSTNPQLNFANMANIDYFQFNNTSGFSGIPAVAGSYNLSFNNQHLGTFDLINGPAAQFSLKNVEADELNYSALSYKPMFLMNATCGNLNILSPCSFTISSCGLNNVNGDSLAQVSIIHPKMNSDLNIDGFNKVTLLSISNTEPQKDINLNNMNYATLGSIICDNLNADNAAQIDFSASNYNLNINNLKLNSVASFEGNFLSAIGNLKYGEFKNINYNYMTMPTATTFFTNGALVDNVKNMYISSGTLSNFTFNNPEYLQISRATILDGELTAKELKAQTGIIARIENVSIGSLVSASNFTLNNIKNLTMNDALDCANNNMANVSNGYFDVLPLGFDMGMSVNSWHINNLTYSYINWINNDYMSVSNMTVYTGSRGWFGNLSTFIGDNLYNTSSSGKYTIKNVNDITINNIEFTGSNSIYINNFANLEINKINNNTGNVIYVNGQYLLQNNVKISNFEGLKTMHLDEISQLKLENGTVSNLFVEGNTQNFGGLTMSNVSIDNAYFTNLSFADFGNGSCDELNVSNVLNCVNPFSYCHDVYIDAAHSANLTNYVLSWQVSHVI